jgi:mannan endo-1,4-beta-mannosidase
MSQRRGPLRAIATTVAALTVFTLGVGVAEGAAGTAATTSVSQVRQLTTPAQKYFGVYLPQAPYQIAPVDKVAQEVGKAPNMSLFYNSWSTAASGTSNIAVGAVQNACNAGMLPMLTWESWSTTDTTSQGVNIVQPDFAPAVIASGTYDAYITATAEKLKAINCPIALRLDQEVNGSWYPWGITTAGMNNTPADYIAMWRHVWDIFNQVGVTNVLWVWSPNVQSATHPGLPGLSASYPGDKYVDWIGVDGYIYNNPTATFKTRFQPTLDQLRGFVANKPWIIAECGVGTGASKPAQIANLISAVARHKRLSGMNYFDTYKRYDASNWLLDETASSLDAFKSAIASPAFGSATPGVTPGS